MAPLRSGKFWNADFQEFFRIFLADLLDFSLPSEKSRFGRNLLKRPEKEKKKHVDESGTQTLDLHPGNWSVGRHKPLS
jgi:hypothetical protein